MCFILGIFSIKKLSVFYFLLILQIKLRTTRKVFYKNYLGVRVSCEKMCKTISTGLAPYTVVTRNYSFLLEGVAETSVISSTRSCFASIKLLIKNLVYF